MEYKVVRKKIKNMYARLDDENNLVITAPLLVPLKTIERFAEESYEKLMKRMQKRPKKTIFNEFGEMKILGKYTKIENVSELNGILLVTLKDYIKKNYMNIINMMDIESVPSIKIKKVKNYLGQYNKKEHLINLNILIGHLDEECIEYVIIHELAHTRYMNHQEKFWQEVERYCPNYKKLRLKCKKEFVYYENY